MPTYHNGNEADELGDQLLCWFESNCWHHICGYVQRKKHLRLSLFAMFSYAGEDAENNPAAIGTAGEAWSLVTSSRLQYAGVAQMVEHRISNPGLH